MKWRNGFLPSYVLIIRTVTSEVETKLQPVKSHNNLTAIRGLGKPGMSIKLD